MQNGRTYLSARWSKCNVATIEAKVCSDRVSILFVQSTKAARSAPEEVLHLRAVEGFPHTASVPLSL